MCMTCSLYLCLDETEGKFDTLKDKWVSEWISVHRIQLRPHNWSGVLSPQPKQKQNIKPKCIHQHWFMLQFRVTPLNTLVWIIIHIWGLLWTVVWGKSIKVFTAFSSISYRVHTDIFRFSQSFNGFRVNLLLTSKYDSHSSWCHLQGFYFYHINQPIV